MADDLVTVAIPRDLRARLRHRAADEDTTPGLLARRVIEEYVSRPSVEHGDEREAQPA